MMRPFDRWLASINDGWTDAMDEQWIQEQQEKHLEVYRATQDFLSHYGIYISWDGEYYRITNDRTLLDYAVSDRTAAYKEALLIAARKFHELKGAE